MKKKGQSLGLGSLISVVLIFVIAGLLAVFSIDIISDTQLDIGKTGCSQRSDGYTGWNETVRACYNGSNVHVPVGTAAYNGSDSTLEGVGKVPEKMPTLGNVVKNQQLSAVVH